MDNENRLEGLTAQWMNRDGEEGEWKERNAVMGSAGGEDYGNAAT